MSDQDHDLMGANPFATTQINRKREAASMAVLELAQAIRHFADEIEFVSRQIDQGEPQEASAALHQLVERMSHQPKMGNSVNRIGEWLTAVGWQKCAVEIQGQS